MKACPSVYLIGMMGAGKTTIGRILARELRLEFIDCDRELEARSGVPIATIFELEGEEAFRKREAALIDELTCRPGVVLAMGGGAVLRPENRAHMRARGVVIFLEASVDEILRRTKNDRARPLLQTENRRGRIEQLLEQRGALYASTAHLTFQSGAVNPRKLVARIVANEAFRHAIDAA